MKSGFIRSLAQNSFFVSHFVASLFHKFLNLCEFSAKVLLLLLLCIVLFWLIKCIYFVWLESVVCVFLHFIFCHLSVGFTAYRRNGKIPHSPSNSFALQSVFEALNFKPNECVMSSNKRIGWRTSWKPEENGKKSFEYRPYTVLSCTKRQEDTHGITIFSSFIGTRWRWRWQSNRTHKYTVQMPFQEYPFSFDSYRIVSYRVPRPWLEQQFLLQPISDYLSKHCLLHFLITSFTSSFTSIQIDLINNLLK